MHLLKQIPEVLIATPVSISNPRDRARGAPASTALHARATTNPSRQPRKKPTQSSTFLTYRLCEFGFWNLNGSIKPNLHSSSQKIWHLTSGITTSQLWHHKFGQQCKFGWEGRWQHDNLVCRVSSISAEKLTHTHFILWLGVKHSYLTANTKNGGLETTLTTKSVTNLQQARYTQYFKYRVF